MDVFAHGLWTNIMYRSLPQTRNDKKTIWWGIVFGVIPDLISFTPIFISLVLGLAAGRSSLQAGRPDFPEGALANYASQSYNYTHSFLIFLAVMAIVWLVRRKFPWIFLGWGLHIVIDIFSHTKEFYATPFLFPLSDFQISAVSWAHPLFMAINYILLILLYVFLIPKLRNKNSLPNGREKSSSQ